MNPLLSVIVPTRNRADTALSCIRHILSFPQNNFELVVRDCSDTRILEDQLAYIMDDRLVYEYAQPVCMTENWNKALELAKGDYICIIGDDDGLNPHTLNIVTWLASQGVQSLTWPDHARYFWPDYPDPKFAGHLFLTEFSGIVSEISAPKALMDRVLRKDDRVPLSKAYHGIVARESLEFLKKRTGIYFKTKCPDVYASYVLTGILKKYHVIDYPVTVGGASGKSNGARILARNGVRQHIVEYEPEDRGLDILVPPVLTQEVFYADPMIGALRALGEDELIERFVSSGSLAILYALSLGQNPEFALEIIQHLWNKALRNRSSIVKTKILAQISKQFIVRGIRYMSKVAFAKLTDRPWGWRKIKSFPAKDIAEVIDILKQVKPHIKEP